jgi:hypothetical protein
VRQRTAAPALAANSRLWRTGLACRVPVLGDGRDQGSAGRIGLIGVALPVDAVMFKMPLPGSPRHRTS